MDYDEFGARGVPERRVLYGTLTAEEKAALWREHFTRYLNTHPDLSPEQRELIGENVELNTADLHRGSMAERPEQRERLERLQERAIELFGWREARDLFATLGPPEAA
jgi:hypothetical protein